MAKQITYEIENFRPYSLHNIVHSVFGYAGIVLKRMTLLRGIVIVFNFLFAAYLSSEYHVKSPLIAFLYVIVGSILYTAYLCLVYRKNGIRDYLIKKYGEEKAYNIYEAWLAFFFFHSGVALVYFNLCFPSDGEALFSWLAIRVPFIEVNLQYVLYLALFSVGLVAKLWSAIMVGVDIYYCRDMFLKRNVIEFCHAGIYKYFKNPMYGIGHLHAYSIPLQYNSLPGYLVAILNQMLIFVFYYGFEKPFIVDFHKED